MKKHSLIDARFKGNVLFSYGAQVATIGLGFISVTIITRYAGIETYGMVAVMTSLSAILSNLLTFRTNEAVVNFYKRGQVENTLGLCRLALLAGLMLDLVMGVLLYLLVNFFAPTIADSLLKHPEAKEGVIIFSGIMLANFLRGTALGLLVAEERFRFINSLSVTEQALKVILLSAMVYFGIILSFENLIIVMLIPAVLVTSTVYLFPLYKLLGALRTASISRDRIGDYARFSLSTFLSSSLKAGNQNIDTIILGYLTNPANVGIYNLFRQFLSPILMLAGPVSVQVYPRFVKAVAEQKPEVIRATIAHANSLLMRGFLLMLIIIIPSIIGYWHWNNLNFTTEYYVVFVIMMVSALLTQQLWWVRSLSNAVNPNISLVANIVSMIIVILVVPVLIINFGLIGCAVGMMVNYLGVRFFYRQAFNGTVYGKL